MNSNSQHQELEKNLVDNEEIEDFETAMKKLEAVIDEIENGKITLEGSIYNYEKGMKLINSCQKKIAEVEQKIKILSDSNELSQYQ